LHRLMVASTCGELVGPGSALRQLLVVRFVRRLTRFLYHIPPLVALSLALCLGQGTFGKVKLAKHNESGIEYAIKILDKSDIKDNALTVNVRREVRLCRMLSLGSQLKVELL